MKSSRLGSTPTSSSLMLATTCIRIIGCLRSHLEHVARPPDLGVRDSEVRWRSRLRPTSLFLSRGSRRREGSTHPRVVSQPGNKHWFDEDLFLGLMRVRGMEVASTRAMRRLSPVGSCPSSSDEVRTIRESLAPGLLSPSPSRTSVVSSRGHGTRGSLRTAVSDQASCRRASRITELADASGHALPGLPAPRRRSLFGARRARSSTSRSISGPIHLPTWSGSASS